MQQGRPVSPKKRNKKKKACSRNSINNIYNYKSRKMCKNFKPKRERERENIEYDCLWRPIIEAAAAAKLLQSCPTLCDPIDGSPRGSSVPGILQTRTLEWVAISFSNAWKWKVKVKSLSRVQLLATSRTAAYEAPPSMGFSRQEYWSGVPLPSPWIEEVRGKKILSSVVTLVEHMDFLIDIPVKSY